MSTHGSFGGRSARPAGQCSYTVHYKQQPQPQTPTTQPQQPQYSQQHVSAKNYPRHKMDFFMKPHELRPEIRQDYPQGIYTLDLIRVGRRIATTRSYPLGEIGEVVLLYNSQEDPRRCPEVLVTVLGTEKLDIRTPEQQETWSKKEGWAVEHLRANQRLWNEWQTTFQLCPQSSQ